VAPPKVLLKNRTFFIAINGFVVQFVLFDFTKLAQNFIKSHFPFLPFISLLVLIKLLSNCCQFFLESEFFDLFVGNSLKKERKFIFSMF